MVPFYTNNRVLIEVCRYIKDEPAALIERMTHYFDAYNSQPDLDSRAMFYYELRDHYNNYAADDTSIDKCAMFILLNKTCVRRGRGLQGQKSGSFNVSFGNYKSDAIIDTGGIFRLHQLPDGSDADHQAITDCLAGSC
jgi:site-specific DNA-adenine methylase